MKATATVGMNLENADLLFTIVERSCSGPVNVRGTLVSVGSWLRS